VSGVHRDFTTITESWDVDCNIAAVTDPKAGVVGRKLADPVSRSDSGTDGVLLGKGLSRLGEKPHQVSVDFAEPR
jgi:hypothetical protein